MPRPTYAAADWYDLPRYYDLVFDTDTAVETKFLAALPARFGGAGGAAAGRVLEPACGSGRLIASLAASGWQSYGFDINPNMLAYARGRAPAGAPPPVLWHDRMESFTSPLPPGSFGLAHCLVSTFKYLLDERSAHACLTRIGRALAPGGLLALGLHLSDMADRRFSRERWYARDGALEVVCNIQSAPACRRRRLEAMRARLLVRRGRRQPWGCSETTWNFRTYSARQLTALIASVPTLEHLATYGFAYDLARPQPLAGQRLDALLVLRRRPGGRRRPPAAGAAS